MFGFIMLNLVSLCCYDSQEEKLYKIANEARLKAEADKLRAEKKSAKQNKDFWNDALK